MNPDSLELKRRLPLPELMARCGDGDAAQVRALCPFHDDKNPSFSVWEGDGSWLWKCHAGCGEGDEIHYLEKKYTLDTAGAFAKWRELAGVNGNHKKSITATYDYTDAAGKLLFQAVRFDPKDFRQRRPDGAGGWTWNLKGIAPVLYRLPAVLAAQTVWIVEGEKDADNLTALGFVATTNPMGAGKWRKEYNESLAGRHVVIIPDNDAPGRKHAGTVADSLNTVAASVKTVALPDSVKDVSDFIAARTDAAALLAALARFAPLGNPAQVTSDSVANPTLLEDAAPQFIPPNVQEVAEAIRDTPLAAYLHAAVGFAANLPPEFALVDGILLGCLCLAKAGRLIGLSEDDAAPQACNAYVGKFAPTAGGKGTSTAVFAVFARELDIARLSGESKPGVLTCVLGKDHHKFAQSGWYHLPEVSVILDRRNVVGSAIAELFLQCFDSGRFEWGTKREKLVADPFYPSLLVEGQPARVEDAGGATNLSNGFIGRFLVAYPTVTAKGERTGPLLTEEAVKAYSPLACGDKIIVRPVEGGDTLRGDAWWEHMTDDERGMWQRLRTQYLWRIAAILDAPRLTGKHPRIGKDAVRRAGVLIDFFFGQGQRLLALIHADPWEGKRQKVLRWIQAHHPASPRSIYLAASMSKRDCDAILETLTARGTVAFDGKAWRPCEALTGNLLTLKSLSLEGLASLTSYQTTHTQLQREAAGVCLMEDTDKSQPVLSLAVKCQQEPDPSADDKDEAQRVLERKATIAAYDQRQREAAEHKAFLAQWQRMAVPTLP
jgi:5S rRNA maturation endonuclease (ribonuclease M5)